MVFVNTKVFVERVARALERAGYRVGVLSGDVPQKKRESLLKKFQAGQLEILVATDVAARGLHIDGVEYVYNYDLPFDAEDYVHRIGRTARLGKEGDAISFACERYAVGLPDIEAFIEQKIPSEPVTQELLTALPRKPREGVEVEAAEGESVGEIFREAREQRAADEARRGGGRAGGRREGGSGRGRDGDESRRRRGPRDGRGPRADQAQGEGQTQPAPAAAGQDDAAQAAASSTGTGAETASGTPRDEAPRPPRRRRRRRRRGGGQGQAQGEGNRQDAGSTDAGGNAQGGASDAAAGPDNPSAGPQDDAARPPRKRRRRRGGRRVNGGEGAPQASPGPREEGNGQQPPADRSRAEAGGRGRQQPKPSAGTVQPARGGSGQSATPGSNGPRHVPAKAAAPKASPSESGGLISRIGRGLRKLVARDTD